MKRKMYLFIKGMVILKYMNKYTLIKQIISENKC